MKHSAANGARIVETQREHFRDFFPERFVRSRSTQNQLCKAHRTAIEDYKFDQSSHESGTKMASSDTQPPKRKEKIETSESRSSITGLFMTLAAFLRRLFSLFSRFLIRGFFVCCSLEST
jgi:hypothetical protein